MFDVQTRLLLALGHTIRNMDGTGTITYNLRPFTPDSVAYIEDLLTKIDEVDEAYSSALADSMAVRVDTLHLDYGKHLSLLAARGTSYLERLSAFVNVPIQFNRFTGQFLEPIGGSSGTSKGNPPISVKSYY